MDVGVIFPPASYSHTAPIHVGIILSILKNECETDSVKYLDYNETKFYLYERLLGEIDKKYREEILGKWSKDLFVSEAILLYERGILEKIMETPPKSQFTSLIANSADLLEFPKKGLVRIFEAMLHQIDISSLNLLILVPPSPDLYDTLILSYLAKKFERDLPIAIFDYYNFDPSTPYLTAFITDKNWSGENIKAYLEYDPLYSFLKKELFSIVDYIVQGEGYDVIRTMFNSSHSSYKVRGLKFCREKNSPERIELDKSEITSKEDVINIIYSNPVDLDDLPFPDFEQMQRAYDIAQLEISRGCPYRCIFCERSPFVPNIRFHTSKYMLELISYLCEKYDFKEYSFFDTSLNMVEEKTIKILEHISRAGVFVKYSAQLRPKIVKERLIQLMKATGCYEIGIGLESGDERVLKDMQKDSNLRIHKNIIRKIAKYDIHLAPYIVFAFPTDNVHSVKNTMEMIKYISQRYSNFDIGMGFYWWGYIQRLSPESFQRYGIRIHNPFTIKKQSQKISYLLSIPGLCLAFEYTKGMNRSQMWNALRQYYKLSEELNFPLYAAEPRPVGKE